MGEAALAPSDTLTSHRKPTKRLTAEDVGTLLRYHAEGLSQVQIAQRLDCDQAAVSRWLAKLSDTTDLSKSYLRAQSFRMAQNIVKNGLPRDHINALRGIGVLEDKSSAELKLLVGIALPGMPEASTPQGLVVAANLPEVSAESLGKQAGSDNQSSVNEQEG
jgi:hypothetical protein